MKTIIVFDAEGRGASIAYIAKDDLADHEYLMPEAYEDATFAQRFALEGGEIVDLYPGMTNDEAMTAHAEWMKTEDRKRLAASANPGLSEIESVRKSQLGLVRKHFDAVIQGVRADAAAYEVETWAVQRDEYARWVADPQAATPYVDGLCAGRGVTKAELMPKIGAKVAGMASIQGMQHATEKEIEAAETIEAILAVTIPGA